MLSLPILSHLATREFPSFPRLDFNQLDEYIIGGPEEGYLHARPQFRNVTPEFYPLTLQIGYGRFQVVGPQPEVVQPVTGA